jgi:ABC-type antimicrobial peptide transport system permease subunit
MLSLRRLLFGLAALRRRREKERELEEELRFHIEEETGERAAAGMSLQDAELAVRKDFGNMTLVRESTREAWGWSSLDRLFQDVRYGLRTLTRNPAFALAAILSLALGIGANTAIFSLLDAVLLRSLPVRNPEQLVIFAHRSDKAPSTGANYPLFETLRQHSKSFSDVIAFWPIEFRLRSGAEFEMTEGQYITTNYFSSLGVQPIAGRVFSDADFDENVIVISYGLWQRAFGGSPDAVGKTINVNGTPLTVIGVAPPHFFGLQLGWKLEFFVPFGLQKRLSPEFGDRLAVRDGLWNIAIVGRLREGVLPETARSEAEVLVRPWVNEFMGINSDWERIELLPGSRGLDGLRRRYSKPLWVLMIITTLVLLISCANVANLLLARAANRQREMAVRLSIGASRKRLLRQLLTESLLLSFLGGAASLVLAVWSARLLVVLMSGRNPLILPVGIDPRILAFTSLASLLTGLIFGVLLNESAARFYFAGTSPIGRTFRLARESTSPLIEIVGVARDAKQRDLREPTARTVFLPLDQSPGAIGSIQIRSIGAASSLIPALRAAARSVSADAPISSIRTVREQVDANLSQERMIATLSTAFGALALFLAAVGLYGVISYSVSTRTGEIGIRMALGASAGSVLGLVGREAARLVLAGVAGGLGAAFVSTRFIEESMLFGLTATDVATLAIATIALVAIAGLAVLAPALRAARTNPSATLRHE